MLDVGGDDVGARVLSSVADSFTHNAYEMFLVLNANRPFTADVASSRKMIEDIESASRLKFTGIISNTHLMETTTPEVVQDGLALAQDVGEVTGLRIAFFSATTDVLQRMNLKETSVPVLPLNRLLLKPWERSTTDTD